MGKGVVVVHESGGVGNFSGLPVAVEPAQCLAQRAFAALADDIQIDPGFTVHFQKEELSAGGYGVRSPFH